MKVGDNGIALIQKFEGLKTKPYRDCIGLWTVGVGTLIGDGKSLPDNWNREFTLDECYALLRKELAHIERGIDKYISVQLTQNQMDALCSFVYNLGLGCLQRSTLRAKLNRGDIPGALESWAKYNKAGGKVWRGLTLRRQAEIALFKGE
jgi:GH24 family phage-related lysozyme (muramidase)